MKPPQSFRELLGIGGANGISRTRNLRRIPIASCMASASMAGSALTLAALQLAAQNNGSRGDNLCSHARRVDLFQFQQFKLIGLEPFNILFAGVAAHASMRGS